MQTLQSPFICLISILLLLLTCANVVRCGAPPPPKPPQNHPRDLSALLSFKSHITSDPQNILTNTWTTNTSFCTWTGISCSRRRPRVTALELVGLSLTGTIASGIGNLSFLSILDLDSNKFSGPLPPSICNLRRLTVLSIFNNSLVGPIPPSIFNASSLQFLSLAGNKLSGPIPPSIFNLSSLETLSLNDNSLSGPIPPALYLPRIRSLDLSDNQLTGGIPRELRDLTSLKYLYLYNNALMGPIPPSFGDLTSLEYLWLYNNALTGPIPPSLGNLTRLIYLSLHDNNLSGDPIPPSFGGLTSMRRLSVGFNAFRGGPIPSAIMNMSSLYDIDLSSTGRFGQLPSDFGNRFPLLQRLFLIYNGFTGPIPSSLSNSSQLYIIALDGNMFTGSVPPSIGDLRYLEKLGLLDNRLGGGLRFLSPLLNLNYLHTIEMDNNPFNGFLPEGPILGNFSTSLVIFSATHCSIRGRFSMAFFSNLSNLISLDMSGNELTGSVPTELKNLKGLQMLFLGGNRLEGSIPEEWFQSMINLGTLDLSQNLLSGPISNYLGNLTGLQEISLAGNALSSTIPTSIWGLEGLISLDFSHNFLEGYLPKEVSNLKVLETMDLSSNLLSGFLPSTLGDLQMLANLSLSNNSFSGPIPQSFAHSINLNLLDLSSNSLSGEIPKSLADLRYLSFLNLSFNSLEGEAPNGGVFANLTMQSLMGNTALCGAIKLGLPTCKISDPKTSSKVRKMLLRYVFPSLILCVAVFVGVVLYLLLSSKIKKSGVSNSVTWDPSLLHQRFLSQLELTRATNNFDEANLLGVGSFGSVYKGQLEDGTITAVKVLNFGSSERASKRFEAECEVMRNVRHRNLVKIISCCSSENFKALVLQYMPNKSLDKWLHSSEEHSLAILERVSIMSDVASALEYLHHGCSRPVVHSDVKPSNILLDEDMVAHLGDFGIAKLLVGDYKSATPTSTLGTIGYVAPEYGVSGKASIKGDIYSFGVLLLETFTGRKPTDAMFSNGSSIREWVKEAFPDKILQVIDSNILRYGDIERARPIDDDTDDIKLRDHKCLSSIMELGLSCTKESPKERMNMKDVVVRLNKIKMELMVPSVESNQIYNHSVSEA